ncbi:MAG: 2'-5' RNA ligase family protein [Agathobacter sp.]|nr:2'-5' RNA ligase family protein [Agathobacter sp.]
MYLISLYFDDNTNKRILKHIQNVAEKSGNGYMVEHNVPPHITISAFEACNETNIVNSLENVMKELHCGGIQWIGIGVFKTSTVFIQPVLNEYLHNLSSIIYESVIKVPDTIVSKYYRPFSWLPHATIAKQLSEEEMRKAFDTLQKAFGMFEGEVVRVELAKKNPYRVIKSWGLK